MNLSLIKYAIKFPKSTVLQSTWYDDRRKVHNSDSLYKIIIYEYSIANFSSLVTYGKLKSFGLKSIKN